MSQNTAAPIVTLRGLTKSFDDAYKSANPFWPRLCFEQQSKGRDEAYAILGKMPGMREWLGDRIFKSLGAASFTIENREWENSLKIEKNDIDDDRLGMYGPVLANLATEAAFHPDELMFQLLMAGGSTACIDGQYFFDSDHSWGDSGSQSNDLAPTCSNAAAVTMDEFADGYEAARLAMLSFKWDNGKNIHRPTVGPMSDLLLLVHPDLQKTATKSLTAALVSGGETNIVLDRPEIVACTYFTNPAQCYLFRTAQALKPFVFQARRPLSRQMKGLEDREFKDVKFMCDARYNVGYLAWWNAVRFTFTD